MKLMRYSALVAAVLGTRVIHAQYTAVDLNPPAYFSSSFRHFENGSLIGPLYDDQGAMTWGVWSNDTTFQTLVDNSVAELNLVGTDGIQHVGWGRDNSFTYHARLFNGLGGGVDLHPAGPSYVSSQGADAHSGRQVGSV